MNTPNVPRNVPQVKNFADVFGLPLNDTHIQLINSCKYIKKDKAGEYVMTAATFDEVGNVTFVKEYK